MKPVPISAACLLVLTITWHPASSEPGLAPLVAFKAGLLAGILKTLKIQPTNSSPDQHSYQGTASGDLSFSGSLNGSPYNNNGYGQPHWNGGQLKLTGNVNYSGQRRPISSNGGGTRHQSLRGSVTFNANVNPIHATTIAPVVEYAITPVETFTAPLFEVAPAPMNVATTNNGLSSSSASVSNGYNVGEVHAMQSNSRMPYGYGNVHINVENTGPGIGAVINLNAGRTKVSTSELNAAVEVEPSTYDDLTSFSSTSDDSLAPLSETFSDLSTDTTSTLPVDAFGSYDSFDSVNEFDTTSDNEIVPETNVDLTGTDTDFGETDFSTNFEENTDSFSSTDSFDLSTDSANGASDFNSEFTSDIDTGYTSDISSDFNTDAASDYNTDITSDFNTDVTSDLSTDFNVDAASDYNTDITSDFNTDVTSDFSTDFDDTSVPETSDTLGTNNGFEINTSGYVSGTTNDDREPSVAVSGTNTGLYNSYIQSNVDAIRALSDIAKTHGSGRPVTIRLRTAHRVRPPGQASSSQASSTAGGGLLGIFSDGSRYKVAEAPLLYKYSDVIESTNPTPQRQWQVSASASGNANLNFYEGRSITGGRMRLEKRPTTQGKSIPNQAKLPITIAENVQRAQLQSARNNNNVARTQNRSPARPSTAVLANSSNSRTRPNMPQRSTAPITRASDPVRNFNANTRVASNGAGSGLVARNSNRNTDAKSITDSRRTQVAANSANINNQFGFLGVLARFAEAHRQALINDGKNTPRSSVPDARSPRPDARSSTAGARSPASDARANHQLRNNQAPRIVRHVSSSGSSGKTINAVPIEVRQEVLLPMSPNTRRYRGMLYESNQSALSGSSSSQPQRENIANQLNQPMMNLVLRNLENQYPEVQIPSVPSNRGNLGIQLLPPNPPKSPTSSLQRKENNGVTRAKLRFRYSEVIPSPQP